jgi:hypothetical protein
MMKKLRIKKIHVIFLPAFLIYIMTSAFIIVSYVKLGDAMVLTGFLPLFSSAIPIVIFLNAKSGDK